MFRSRVTLRGAGSRDAPRLGMTRKHRATMIGFALGVGLPLVGTASQASPTRSDRMDRLAEPIMQSDRLPPPPSSPPSKAAARPVADAPPLSDDPPPGVIAASPSPTAPVSSVRLNVRGCRRGAVASRADDKRTRVYLLGIDNSCALLCAEIPCTVDVPAGSELRATLGDREPLTFSVPSDASHEIDIVVGPPQGGERADLGVALTVIGSVGFHLAALVVWFSSWGGRDDVATEGGVVMGIGGVALVSGIVLLATRSKEPRVVVEPTRRAHETYGRKETAFGDVASAKPHDSGTSAPAPFTPLTYGFMF
jgi:hypothetical protein